MIASDNTKQSNASAELNAIFENAAVVLVLVDKRGRVVNINKSGVAMAVQPKREIIGKLGGHVFNCIHTFADGNIKCGINDKCANCDLKSRLSHTFKTGKSHYKEEGSMVFVINGKPRKYDISISSSPITIRNRSYVLLTIDDITKQKQQEHELQKLNDDKDKFISILSHDLRNPFNALIGLTDILIEKNQEFSIEKIEMILHNLNLVTINSYDLLNDLLSWVKSHSGQAKFRPIKFNIKNECQKVINYTKHSAETKEITLIYKSEENINVLADHNMFDTILRNLISNAVKFSDRKSTVTIEAKSENGQAIVAVCDTGIGIDDERISKLFNITQFESRTGTEGEVGSGLGLVLCKELVEINQGKIWVKSQQNNGTTFYFSLPLQQ